MGNVTGEIELRAVFLFLRHRDHDTLQSSSPDRIDTIEDNRTLMRYQ